MPQWAHVWFWLRFMRADQVKTPIPQQGINPEAMSMDSYELYEVEWIEAGAPSASPEGVLAAMGAMTESESEDDDGIPF